jgi:acyl-CoA synthetase (NDP forming)
MSIDFKAIDRLFEGAEGEGRSFLFEHEVYAMLGLAGVAVPMHRFVSKGRMVEPKDLAGFKSAELVLKVVAPLIQHKTDVGGVQFVKNRASAVNAGLKAMMASVPGRFRDWAKDSLHHGSSRVPTFDEIAADIQGVLICEKVAYEKFGFGTEILLGIRNTREFGPVLTMGPGGVEVEFLNERLKEGAAAAIASPHLLAKKDVLNHLEPLAVTAKLIKPFRGRPAVLSGASLRETYTCLAALAAHYSPFAGSRFVIEEAEVNPFVVRDGKLVPLDGLCRFSREHIGLKSRPFAEIARLLRPESIAVIGVSERMNIGHLILNNILKQGFSPERLTVVKPGLDTIEGCRCVPDVASLPETVDLFVLTLGAEQCGDIVAELVAHGKARSVILIAGGMGEKQGGGSTEERIVRILADGRKKGRITPVINGGNCLGIYSKPGRYDTTFIPAAKLRFPKVERSSLAFISQSGAFMISRISKLTRIEPLFAISFGNQLDLRVSDYLNYLKDDPDVRIFAVYMEGFKPGDGYLLAEAAREILKDPARSVVVYKSGRSAEGRLATSSHTASVAGEYGVCRSVLEGAGVFVAETIFEFENMLVALDALDGRPVRGNRVGLISNAGFENVTMSDSLGEGKDRLALAAFADATKARLEAALAPLGIDKLQDVKNPLDTTPVADDAVFAECARAILEDPGVDCAVISPVPMTAALQTLPAGPGTRENILDPGSTPSRLIALFRATDKPFVVNIDAGADYDPMAAMIAAAGMPVFRRSDEAVKFLRRYVGARLHRR